MEKYWMEEDNVSDCECCPLYRYKVYALDQPSALYESSYRDEAEAKLAELLEVA